MVGMGLPLGSAPTPPEYEGASDVESGALQQHFGGTTPSVQTNEGAKILRPIMWSWTRPRLNWRWAHHGTPNACIQLCFLDVVLIGLGVASVLGLSYGTLEAAGPTHIVFATTLSLLTSMTFLYASGCYRWDTVVDRTMATLSLPIAVCVSALLVFGVLQLGPVTLLDQDIEQSAAVVVLCAGVTLCMTALSRGIFYAMVDRGLFRRRILVVGTGERGFYLQKLMAQKAHQLANDLYFVSGAIVGGSSKKVQEELRESVVEDHGRPINLIARDLNIDEIVVALDEQSGIELETLLACKVSQIPVVEYDVFIERQTGRVDLNCMRLSHLIFSEGFKMRGSQVFMKRLVDIVASFAMLIVAFPVLIAAICALLLEGYRPIIFRQERVTQGGRCFWLYKLRTMRPDAEESGPQWSVRGDPRITRVGALLRRTRIDELPQLYNILRGDMSLVGPRPERPVFVQQLSNEIQLYDLRHHVKSGLTGWAQINYPYAASSEDAARKLEYDLYYIKNYSLMSDISIILQTFRVLIWPPTMR